VNDPAQMVLLYFVMPVWFLAGVADWLCHRATDIEHTAGAKESFIHLLMFAEIAVLCWPACSWRSTRWSSQS
jgi:cytochrome c oxidase assembly factor CtaG